MESIIIQVITIAFVFGLILFIIIFSSTLVSAQVNDFWNNTNTRTSNGTFIFERNNAQINITPTIVFNGTQYRIPNFLAFHSNRNNRGWKYSYNISIPGGVQGNFIVRNLREIRLNISTTENIELFYRGADLGFKYLYNQNRHQTYTTNRYIEFSFEDMLRTLRYQATDEEGNNYSETIPRNVTLTSRNSGSVNFFELNRMNFTAGQRIIFDPTIRINDVSVANSYLANITQENNFTRLTLTELNNPTGSINSSVITLYYAFDVNISQTTVYDYSRHGNDGTLINQTHFVLKGTGAESTVSNLGGSMKFDNIDDYIEIPYSDTIQNAIDRPAVFGSITTWSIFAWVNATDNIVDNNAVFAQTNGIGTGRAWMTTTTAGNLNTALYNASVIDVTTGGFVTAGVWHHVGIVYNGSAFIGYIDGIQRGSKHRDSKNESATGTYLIGRNKAGNLDFRGEIDELIILNTSITSQDVADLFNSKKSRFFPRGAQIFPDLDLNETGETVFVNITLNMSNYFFSEINFSLGTQSGNSYTYGTEQVIVKNNQINNLNIETDANFSLQFTFYAGNRSDPVPGSSPEIPPNNFITPSLENNIIIESWSIPFPNPSLIKVILPNIENSTPHIKLNEQLRFDNVPYIKLGQEIKFA